MNKFIKGIIDVNGICWKNPYRGDGCNCCPLYKKCEGKKLPDYKIELAKLYIANELRKIVNEQVR
jgi:hypothetical protein